MTRVSKLLPKEDTFPGARGKPEFMGGAAASSSKSSMYKQGKGTTFCWRMCNAYAKCTTQ